MADGAEGRGRGGTSAPLLHACLHLHHHVSSSFRSQVVVVLEAVSLAAVIAATAAVVDVVRISQPHHSLPSPLLSPLLTLHQVGAVAVAPVAAAMPTRMLGTPSPSSAASSRQGRLTRLSTSSCTLCLSKSTRSLITFSPRQAPFLYCFALVLFNVGPVTPVRPGCHQG